MSRKRGDNGDARTPGVARACHGIRVCKPPGSIKRSDRMCLLAGNKHGGRYRQLAGPLPTVRAPPPSVHTIWNARRYEHLCTRIVRYFSSCDGGCLRDVRNTRYCDYVRVVEITTDELTRLPF